MPGGRTRAALVVIALVAGCSGEHRFEDGGVAAPSAADAGAGGSGQPDGGTAGAGPCATVGSGYGKESCCNGELCRGYCEKCTGDWDCPASGLECLCGGGWGCAANAICCPHLGCSTVETCEKYQAWVDAGSPL